MATDAAMLNPRMMLVVQARPRIRMFVAPRAAVPAIHLFNRKMAAVPRYLEKGKPGKFRNPSRPNPSLGLLHWVRLTSNY
jgi:hypothetical protein